MADASNVQTSFLSGEWSPYAQGLMDDPEYKRGMNVCRNIIPVEAGAAVKRSGTKELSFTRKGQVGRLLNFQFAASTPYTMEFTDGVLRFYSQQELVMAEEPRNVIYINEGTPATLVTSAPCSGRTAWAAGNTVMFNFLRPDTSVACGNLVGRQFLLRAGGDQQHWLMFDAITGQPIDGSEINWEPTMAIQVARIFEITTPYTNGLWEGLRATQSDDMVFLWHPSVQPYAIFAPIDGGNLFTLNAVQFKDGPYLDPPNDGSFLTPSGVSGLINLTLDYPAWSNATTYKKGNNFANNTQSRGPSNSTLVRYAPGTVVKSGGNYYVSIADNNLNHSPPNATYWLAISIQNFATTDVGRQVRLLAEPAQWVAATAYAANDLVKYQDAYYVALQATTGDVPGADPDNWGVAANAAKWTWGIVTGATPTVLTVSIQGDPLLYNQNVLTYRLGVFSDTTGYPSCGAFHEGRLWTGGVLKNRFDASGATGDIFDFAPTAPDGTVSDANSISYVLKSKQRNKIIWMTPAIGGLLMGTSQCEWLVQSSNNNDPITPTNIQAHDHTSIGSTGVDVVRCGATVAFVQRYGNMVFEYLADLFTGKPSGKNLTMRAKHLTAAGIKRIGYQQELVPVLWALTNDGNLIGTTYKRESMNVSQPPNFNAWHRHDLGHGRKVLDMAVGAAPPCGRYETAMLLTQDQATGYCRVEAVSQMFSETSAITDSWFVDGGRIPAGGEDTTVLTVDGVKLCGLGTLEGQTVAAFIAGLDLGDYVVEDGSIFVPYGSDADHLFTLAYLRNMHATGFEYGFRVHVPRAALAETILQFPPISNTVLSRYTYLSYGAQVVADWKNDRVTFLLPGTGPEAGFVQYRISTGAFIQYVTTSEVFFSVNPPRYDNSTAYSANSIVVASNGNLYTVKVAHSYGTDPLSSGQTDWVQATSPDNPTVIPAAYNGATAYATGNFVTSGGFIWKSLQNANTGHTPISSPTFWQLYYATPSAWSATTTYSPYNAVTGSNDHIYTTISDVPAGLGDPSTFSTNNNPYWITDGGVWPVGIITTAGLSLDYNGDIWMYQSGTSFQSSYVKIDGETLRLKGTTTVLVGLSVPTPSSYSTPMRILDNEGNARHDYMLETVDTTPAGDAAPACVVMDANSMYVSTNNVITFAEGAKPVACSTTPQTGFAQSYVLTRNTSGAPSTPSVGLYEINVTLPGEVSIPCLTRLNYWRDPNILPGLLYNATTPIFKRDVAKISPQTVDSTWTFFSGFSGLMYDPNDGNVLVFVGTANPSGYNAGTSYVLGNTTAGYALGSDNNIYKAKTSGLKPDPVTDGGVNWTLVRAKATTTLYLCKFSTDCGRLIWKTAVSNPPAAGDISYPFINLATGYLVWLEITGASTYQIRQIDTLTGESTILFPGQYGVVQQGDAQVFNSETGDIISYVDFTTAGSGTSPPPTPVPPTPNAFTGWCRLNVTMPTYYNVPGVVGTPFTSQGQLLRPVSPQDTGARNGPAFGKTRRNHKFAMSVASTPSGGMKVGATFGRMRPIKLASPGGAALPASQLYTGEFSDTLEDDYTYDGMVCWQSNRPNPMNMLALGGFLQTQDK